MPLSMHAASVPLFVRQLTNLSAILAKAEAHCTAAGVDPRDLLDTRLAPDMLPFPRQVQIASDAAKGAVARLSQVENPGFADTESTFAELRQRIAKTLDFVNAAEPRAFEGSELREVVIQAGQNELRFSGQDFLLHFALPNFFFHVTTAYAILRSKGVPLGKVDYLRGP